MDLKEPARIGMKTSTVKPVLSGHLKIDNTKVLIQNGSLMKVESIVETSRQMLVLICVTSKVV